MSLSLTKQPTAVYTPDALDEVSLADVITLHEEIAAYLAGLVAQGSVTDATAGRLLAVGAFGLGGPLVGLPSDDADAGRVGQFCEVSGTTANLPTGAGAGALFTAELSSGGRIQWLQVSGGDAAVQNTFWHRQRISGVWSAWRCLNIYEGTDPTQQAARPVPRSALEGSLAHIVTKTASASATLDFTEFDPSAFRDYVFELRNVAPATDAVHLLVRMSADGGATWDSEVTDYAWYVTEAGGGNVVVYRGDATAREIALVSPVQPVGSGAGEDGVSAEVKVFDPSRSTTTRLNCLGNYIRNGGDFASITANGARKSTAAVDGVQFYFSAGAIESGEISMYGVRR